jgi:hypothetical protein
LKIELPYDAAIPLLGIYSRNVSQVTIEASAHPCLLQPSYGNSHDALQLKNGLRKLNSHKDEGNFVIHGKWIELDNIILSEVNQVQKYKGHMFSAIC